MNGIECGIAWLTTGLPSTFQRAGSAWPIPASADGYGCRAHSVIRELNSIVASGVSSAPSHLKRWGVDDPTRNTGVVLQDVEAVSAEAAALRDQHAVCAGLRNIHIRLGTCRTR